MRLPPIGFFVFAVRTLFLFSATAPGGWIQAFSFSSLSGTARRGTLQILFYDGIPAAKSDRLLGGGKSKQSSGFRGAERYLRNLSKQVSAIQMKFPEEDMVFIGKPDRLLA